MLVSGYLSIGIGNMSIKLVYGKYKSGHLLISACSILPTPEGSFQEGRIKNYSAIADVIGKEIKSKKIKAEGLIFSFSGLGIVARDVQLPKSNDKEVGQIIKNSIAEFFPMDMSEYLYDYKVLENISDKKGETTRVLLMAAPEGLGNDFMLLGNMLKIPVKSIDIYPNCILKLISNGHLLQRNDNTSESIPDELIIIDLGHRTVHLSIFVKGILKLSRLLPYGLSDMDINRIMQDVYRSCEFFKSNQYIKAIDKTYLCGRGSNMDIIKEYTDNNPSQDIEIINFGHSTNISFGKKAERELKENFNILLCEIGALLK